MAATAQSGKGSTAFSRGAIRARRAAVRTLCYRARVVTVAVAFRVGGDVGDAASIGFVTNAVKTLT